MTRTDDARPAGDADDGDSGTTARERPAGSDIDVDVDVIVGRLRAAGCVFAEEEADVIVESAGGDADVIERFTAERVSGVPLEHVVGWAEFGGLRVHIDRRVFVPRRRSELLVREAVTKAGAGAVVVDLCCGSGAIGAAIDAIGRGRIRVLADGDDRTAFEAAPTSSGQAASAGRSAAFDVYAADLDHAAVVCARRNLGDGRVFEGDLYDALPERLRGQVDVLVVNAPYVPSEAIRTMPAEARLHEAGIALDGGGDGLDVQRRVVAGAGGWLAPGGRLLIETSERQAPATAALFAAAGLRPTIVRDDDLDATVVAGGRTA